MEKIFSNILLPVSFDRSTDTAIEKAIEFANRLGCHLHLLHIANHSFMGLPVKVGMAEKKFKMARLQTKYSLELNKGLMLFTSIETGEPETTIADYAMSHGIDLIFVNDEDRRIFLFGQQLRINKLAVKTNCPVLSIKSDQLFYDHKIIVLPIGKYLPLSKIRVVIYLAKHFDASIHLVTLEKSGMRNEELAYLKKAFQVLRDNTDLVVKCNVIEGEHIGDVAIQYAYSVNAGLIVVNPGPESYLSGFVNRLFSRFVFNESKVPVMTVL